MIVALKMCAHIALWALIVLFNFILWFLFGLLLTGRNEKNRSIAFTVLVGFFLYYSLFTLFALPVMYRWRPLSMLAALWGGAVAVICILSLILNRRVIKPMFAELFKSVWEHKAVCIILVLGVAIQLGVVLYSYQFTLDAAYYVANVTTSLRTNSLGIYNPYTGDWQDHFEMRYFFATYAYQDAVMCKWLGTQALIQTKIIMASAVIILTNMVCYLTAKELTEGKERAVPVLTLLFAGLINFFFITIYTTSAFLLTRTYEGKSILANIVLPMLLLLFIRSVKAGKTEGLLFFVVCIGSTVISNTSNMLVPAALAVLFVPYIVGLLAKKQVKEAAKNTAVMVMCMLPGIVLALVYVAYVKGMFVFYTYPR